MSADSVPIAVTSQVLARGVVLVAVEGELDMITCPLVADELELALRPPVPRLLLADLSGVTFMGSEGLRTLVEAQRRAQDVSARLRVVASTRAVLRPLRLTQLTGYLEVYETREAAVTADDVR
jgi:anti-sigma B factor antagonist